MGLCYKKDAATDACFFIQTKEKSPNANCVQTQSGAGGRTRTGTDCSAWFWVTCVCQFRHTGIFIALFSVRFHSQRVGVNWRREQTNGTKLFSYNYTDVLCLSIIRHIECEITHDFDSTVFATKPYWRVTSFFPSQILFEHFIWNSSKIKDLKIRCFCFHKANSIGNLGMKTSKPDISFQICLSKQNWSNYEY